ncbi:MAG: DUF1080 domain-containing protein [Gemmataceae bacterium]|nr:DUF1080 domain-containing protein [Gemmataceae bacterium]
MQRFIPCAVLALAAVAGAALAQTRSGTVIVRVPADAVVTVGGEKTTQKGTERRFVSPALEPGTYSYQVEATWTEGGKEVKVSKKVTLEAGKTATLDLRSKKEVKTQVPSKPMPKGEKQPSKEAGKKPAGKKPIEEKKPEVKPAPKQELIAPKELGFVPLFNGKDLSGWKTVPETGEPFTVKEGVIVVAGKPAGYFYTGKSYKNYILRFDWKFIKSGNSGLLVHIQAPHKVWPKSVEVQGQQSDHGRIFAIGGASGKFTVSKENQKKAIKIGDWNTTEVVSKDGALTSKINGIEISTGKGNLTDGPFGFQSEGTELHFKNIRIKALPDSAPSDKKGEVQVRNAVAAVKVRIAAQPAVAARAAVAAGGGEGWKDLFNGKNLKGWKFFLNAKDADPAKSFIVKDGEIQVPGFPNGYFYTDKSYKNYVLTYDWTYPKDQPAKTTMNSGCLVHIQPPHKVWPKSVEPQVRYKDHGKFFFIGFGKDSKTEQKFDEAAQQKALKPSYEWNTTEVTCKADGSITVKINGTLVNQGKSELTEGPIGFQSEGARIHFKNIKIKMMD